VIRGAGGVHACNTSHSRSTRQISVWHSTRYIYDIYIYVYNMITHSVHATGQADKARKPGMSYARALCCHDCLL
jgi:hypothetical protein